MTLSPPAIMSTPVRERSLAPDLARGAMLLFIALAHAHMFLAHETTGFRGYAVDGGPLDRVVAGLQVLFVDGRALPMFAGLFGYGLARLVDRRMRSGADWPQARRLVRRRSWWLLAFGFAHALLLFFGDILAAYGFIGLVFTGLLAAKDRTLLRTAGIVLACHVLVVAAAGYSAVAAGHENAAPTLVADPLEAAAMRLAVWSALTPTFYVVDVVPAFAIGIWAARRRVLDEPGRHLGLLCGLAFGGLGFALASRVPYALVQTGHWDAEAGPLWWLSAVLHSAGGYAGGIGGAALIGLVASRLTRPGPVATAIAALGQRSMTFYLAQSAAILVLFYPFTLDLAGDVSMAGSFAVAFAIWLVDIGDNCPYRVGRRA